MNIPPGGLGLTGIGTILDETVFLYQITLKIFPRCSLRYELNDKAGRYIKFQEFWDETHLGLGLGIWVFRRIRIHIFGVRNPDVFFLSV